MASSIRLALCGCLALCVTRSLAAPCPKTGEEPPLMRTVIASKENPETEAWIVSPDCNVTVQTTWTHYGPTDIQFWLTDGQTPGVERVESVPSSVRTLIVRNLDVTRGVDLTNAKSLEIVELYNCSLETLARVLLPENVTRLTAMGNKLTTVSITLPPRLEMLNLQNNSLTALDFVLPSTLETLTMDANPITKLEGVTFPNALEYLSFGGTQISVVRGCKFSPVLQTLKLPSFTESSSLFLESDRTTEILPPSSVRVSIELRETDFQTLLNSNHSTFAANTPSGVCNDTTARVATLRASQICVISDARFEAVYRASEGNGSSATASSTSSPPTATSSDSSSSTKTTVVVVSVVAAAVVMIVAIIGFRLWTKRRAGRRDDEGKATEDGQFTKLADSANSPDAPRSTLVGSSLHSSGSREALPNDVRQEELLQGFRLDEREVVLTGIITRGGSGIVHRGEYRGQAVAVKQMLPGLWRDDSALSSFMGEIRLCATLTHPKIVEFIGITWTSLKDLSVVMEFMGGGDLHDLLYKNSAAEPVNWSESWTSSQGLQMKAKSSIAQDIVEGVAYLHAFPTPILHRDLKARNVLLDTEGNAKLSDFGISRELLLDKTMTREVGTSAWIAPEVLRGERYSEKADIYSLGVLLVEMDRCGHPYGSQDMRGYQVAVLVSTGSLRPEVTPESPVGIRSLVERCVTFDPASRPSVVEVLDMIQDNNK